MAFSVGPIGSITIHMCKYFAEQIYLLREYWFSSCDYYGTNSFGWIHGEKKSRIKILWSGSRSPCLYGNLWCKHTFILLHCVREIGFSTLLYSSWNFFPNRSQFAYETDETTFFGIEIMSYKHFDVFFVTNILMNRWIWVNAEQTYHLGKGAHMHVITVGLLPCIKFTILLMFVVMSMFHLQAEWTANWMSDLCIKSMPPFKI